MSDISETLASLSDVELKVIGILHTGYSGDFGYGNCFYGHDSILSGGYDGNIPSIEVEIGGRKGLSKVLKKLRDLDLVVFKSGLMTEDGEVAGSGNAPNPAYEAEFQELCKAKGWE